MTTRKPPVQFRPSATLDTWLNHQGNRNEVSRSLVVMAMRQIPGNLLQNVLAAAKRLEVSVDDVCETVVVRYGEVSLWDYARVTKVRRLLRTMKGIKHV